MAFQQCRRHPQQRLLEGIGIGDHAAQKHIGSPHHSGDRRTQTTTGAGFGHRQGLAAPPQPLQHHRGQAVLVGPVAEPAGAGAQLQLDRLQQRFRRRLCGGAGREPQLHLASPGIGGHGGILQFEQIGHLLGQAGFGHAPKAQQPTGIDPLGQAGAPQPGGGRSQPHRLHLTGHPREGEHGETGLQLPIPAGGIWTPDHPRGGARGVGQQLRPHRQQGLAAVAGRQQPAAGAGLGLDVGPHLRPLPQRCGEGSGDRLGGEVIGGGTQPTGGDQQATAAGRGAHGGDQPLAVVAHHLLAVVGNAEGGQLLGDPAGIAINDVAQQQLGANAEDLRASQWPSRRAGLTIT